MADIEDSTKLYSLMTEVISELHEYVKVASDRNHNIILEEVSKAIIIATAKQ